MTAVLLDTCAVIWLANGDTMKQGALEAIVQAGQSDGIFVSPISAWEIGLLGRARGDRPPAVRCLPDPATWFDRLMRGPGIKPATFTPAIAIAASYLPGDLHADPADRLIIATSRQLGMPVVTRDGRMADYAAQGHVKIVAC